MAHGYLELPPQSSLKRLEILCTKQLQAQFTITNWILWSLTLSSKINLLEWAVLTFASGITQNFTGYIKVDCQLRLY